MRMWISAAVFLITVVVGTFLFSKLIGGRWQFGEVAKIEVNWRDLGELDYVTGAAPEKLKKLDGELVKIPGFMVPLEDNVKQVTQFLLVPTPQACIHVPPPPPNQMLLVDVPEGVDVAYGPIWVHGILRIKTQRTQYGDVNFGLEGKRIQPYE